MKKYQHYIDEPMSVCMFVCLSVCLSVCVSVCLSVCVCRGFIPRHTLVARYYVIPFGVCPSVRPSVLTISDR